MRKIYIEPIDIKIGHSKAWNNRKYGDDPYLKKIIDGGKSIHKKAGKGNWKILEDERREVCRYQLSVLTYNERKSIW